MKRFALFFLLTAVLLTSCSSQDAGTNPSLSAAVLETDSLPEQRPSGQSAPIQIAYWEEEALKPGTFENFAVDSSEHSVKVLVTPNAAVTNFRYVELSFQEEENGTLSFSPVKELLSLKKLSPGRPFVIEMSFAGLIPDRGILFQEEDGTEKRYTIQISGKDGSLLLAEF